MPVCVHMHMCVYPSSRGLITSGVKWCDIDHVYLVKPMIQLSLKVDWHGFSNTARCAHLAKKMKFMPY